MEKGSVRSISGSSGGGTIADNQGRLVQFGGSDIVRKDRMALKTGDTVWFEKVGIAAAAKAINIRLC